MRLTLRTLLAYRDGVLSSADIEDLHRRIQQSQDAGNLLRRINAVTRLTQMLAPAVLGKGLGGDPNSIAEYLDDSLPLAEVPELERACLVSDVQLAELADCHEVLSSAMQTKVSVPADLRRMALAIGDSTLRPRIEQELQARKTSHRNRPQPQQVFRSDPGHSSLAGRKMGVGPNNGSSSNAPPASTVFVQVEAPMVASGGESIKQQGLNLETSTLAHEVPEYLVGSPTVQWRTPLAIGALFTVLLFLVWQTLGPWERVAELFTALPPPKPHATASHSAPLVHVIAESEQAPAGVGASKEETAVENKPSSGSSGEIVEEFDAAPSGVLSEGSLTTLETPFDVDSPARKTADVGQQLNGRVSLSPRAVWLPHSELDQQAILVTQNGNRWARVEAGESLGLNSKLVVPPQTRTTVDLPSGVLWTVCGPSVLELTANAAGKPMLHTQFCRGLARGGPDGRQLWLSTPLGEYAIELPLADSLASVEMAFRPANHGSVLEQQVFKPVLIILAAESKVVVESLSTDAAGKATPPQQLELGEGVAFIAGQEPQVFRLRNIPAWYSSSVERPIDGLAAEDLHRLLGSPGATAAGLLPVLAELAENRKPESAALAVQLSMLLGDWHPLASGFFSNDRLRSHWTPALNLARQLLASAPTAAEELQAALSVRHGERGPLLFELIVGLSEDQIASGGLTRLTRALDSQRLDERVLAAYQLQDLTGKTLGYQAQAVERASVQQWRRELATNRLNLLPRSDLIWERAGK